MKRTILQILFVAILATGCNSQQADKKEKFQFNDDKTSVLDFYRQYSKYTNPGEYAYLYKDLPDSLPELCRLIRSQFLHLYAELPGYSDIIPKERWNESLKYPTVSSVLKGLMFYDSRGLVYDRKPKHRLVLGCRDYAVLLASVLKYRGIPARVRAGHANYLIPNFHASHTICEVWNERDNRWMLVDPSTDMIDFDKDEFDYSNDTWLQMQDGEIDPDTSGFPGKYSGSISIVGKVFADLAMILGEENTIYQYPPILDYAFKNQGQLKPEHVTILNRLCVLMKTLNAPNLSKLQDIYNNTPDIKLSKTFDIQQIQAKTINKSSQFHISLFMYSL